MGRGPMLPKSAGNTYISPEQAQQLAQAQGIPGQMRGIDDQLGEVERRGAGVGLPKSRRTAGGWTTAPHWTEAVSHVFSKAQEGVERRGLTKSREELQEKAVEAKALEIGIGEQQRKDTAELEQRRHDETIRREDEARELSQQNTLTDQQARIDDQRDLAKYRDATLGYKDDALSARIESDENKLNFEWAKLYSEGTQTDYSALPQGARDDLKKAEQSYVAMRDSASTLKGMDTRILGTLNPLMGEIPYIQGIGPWLAEKGFSDNPELVKYASAMADVKMFYENPERHSFFGGALTPTEKVEWEAGRFLSPNMSPDVYKGRLDKIIEYHADKAKKSIGGYLAGGFYDPAQVSAIAPEIYGSATGQGQQQQRGPAQQVDGAAPGTFQTKGGTSYTVTQVP